MGNLPPNPGTSRPATSVTAACVGALDVRLHWGNDADVSDRYMKDSRVRVGGEVTVRVTGPDTREATTTTGTLRFDDLPCGTYQVTARFSGTDPLVEAAKRHVGSTRWAFRPGITSLDGRLTLRPATNKCNFFIYDMVQQTFGTAPTYTYARRFEWLRGRHTVPALARHWAASDTSSGDPTPGWQNISFQDALGDPVPPGAILGIENDTLLASGHVGIVAYPDDGTTEATVAAACHAATVVMQGKTISAATNDVVHNDWGFRTSETPVARSLNSPAAGIEVRTE